MKTFLKTAVIIFGTFFLIGCSGPDVGTKIAGMDNGTPAEQQKISGKTMLMDPKLEDVTDNDFNIRYIEISFGTGTPLNVRDLAISQCKKVGKSAYFHGASRGIIQLNTVKAYYKCS